MVSFQLVKRTETIDALRDIDGDWADAPGPEDF